MDKLEVTMDISDASLETLTAAIMEDIQEKVQDAVNYCDFDDKIESGIDAYDFDDKIQSWVDYNLDVESDIKDVIRHMDLSEYLDTDDIDIENSVRNLMQGFSPINACSTGLAAMEVIQSTIRYLLLKDEDFVNDISKAIKKAELSNVIAEENAKAVREAKDSIIEEFKRELNEYASQVRTTEISNPAIITQSVSAWH
jgi:hypothetical protein